MELKDFVAETLKQIVAGVSSAQQDIKEKGATVNPHGIQMASGILYATDRQNANSVQMIDFDISLIATQDNELKGGIGVFFGSIGLGAQGKSDTGSSATNRVKFSVPLKLPYYQ